MTSETRPITEPDPTPKKQPAPRRLFVVWSEEHGAWWHKRWGYTTSLVAAGRFTERQAKQIVDNANRYSVELKEVAIPDPLEDPTP